MNDNIEKIVKLSSFDKVFSTMFNKDSKTAENIYNSLEATVKDTHSILEDNTISEEKLKATLLTEIINVQSHASQYLNLIQDMSRRGEELWKSSISINESFFDDIYSRLDIYFEAKKERMSKDIETHITWYTGMTDVAKKGGKLLNLTTKGINTLAERTINRELNIKEIDDKTYMEELLGKYLHKELVQKEIYPIFEECAEQYKKAWVSKISEQLPELREFTAFSLPNGMGPLGLEFQLGASEQALLMGLGSAAVGTLGLAAGWHTLTYSLMNVFPPIAAFTAIATVLTGILTKNKSVEQKKKLVAEAVNQYHRHIVITIETSEIKELRHLTLRKHIINSSNQIINNTMSHIGGLIMGDLTIEDYKELTRAFQSHLNLLNELVPVTIT